MVSAARDLPDVERAFAHEVAWGVNRWRARLDHLLTRVVDGGIDALHPGLLQVLRIGLYQLVRLDRVPAYAAVSQAVDMTALVDQPRARGLVNAVLRRAGDAGDGPELFPSRDADPAAHLAAAGSHPRWLVDRWLARWTVDEVEALLAANNTIPATHLVPFDGDAIAAAARLEAAGLGAEADSVSGTVRLADADPTAALSVVPGFVQDPAAALVCRYAAPKPGSTVLDLCAAPGGKALSLSRTAGYLLAADPAASRLRLLRENAARAPGAIGVVRARAEDPPVRSADLVLVDAPCSGTGTLRRHPDARWRLTPEDPARFAEIQARILRTAADVVSPGGVLVYSTCTLEPEENRERIEAFLDERPDFELDPPADPGLALREDGTLEVVPRADVTDGAFAARMRREGNRE